jgi:hypothetical protein
MLRSPDFAAILTAMEPLVAQFGLSVVDEVATPLTEETYFRNATTGLRVVLDWSEMEPMLYLYRLAGEQAAPVPPKSWDEDQRHSVATLIGFRDPDGDKPYNEHFARFRDPESVRVLLSRYAKSMLVSAADVLRGDFTVFPTLTERVREANKQFEEGPKG